MKRFFLFLMALMFVCSVNVFGQEKKDTILPSPPKDESSHANPGASGAQTTGNSSSSLAGNGSDNLTANKWLKDNNDILNKNVDNVSVSDSDLIKKAKAEYDKLQPKDKEKNNVKTYYDNLCDLDEKLEALNALNAEVENWKNTYTEILSKCENPDNITAGDTVPIQAAIDAYNELSSEAQESLKDKKAQLDAALTKAGEEDPNEPKELEESKETIPTFVLVSGIILLVLILLLYVIVFVSKKNRDKNIIKAIRESEDREFKKKILSVVLDSQTFKEKLQNEIGKSAGNAKSYDSDISALQRRIATLEDSLKKANNAGGSTYASVQQTSAPTPQQPQPSKSLYAESIVDKKFNKVKENPTEDTIFELILVGDTRARVTIYRQAYQKVLANPAFLDGCSKQMIGRNSVTVESEGRAEKDDNGKWMLTEPVKVVLR